MKHLKLELRHWTQADAMELTSLCNAVDRRFLSDRLPIYWAIVCDEKLIGSISVEKKDDDAEIGYMILNEYTNKGIATEAVKQICSIAFKALSIEQITANVFQPNIASIRVLLKNGFKYKGTIPNAVIKDGNVYDLLIYVLTKETR